MAYQADTVFLPVSPSFRGFSAAMVKGVTAGSAEGGLKAGATFSKSFASSAAKSRDLDAVEKKIADTVSAASKKMGTARSAEEDATRKARIEELKLQELRDSGKAKAAQLASAEDRLIRAQRQLRDAQDATRKSTQDYDDAIERGTRELKAAEAQAGKTGGAFHGLGRLIKTGVKEAGAGAFDELTRRAKRGGESSGRSFGSSFGGGIKAGLGVAAGAIALLKGLDVGRDFAVSSIAEARESQKVGAVSAAIIKSTGGAAKISAAQLGDLTTAISNKTGVDDEAIQSGSNLLLTFKNVRNEVGQGNAIFDRATAAAVDLSKAGFGSIASGSKMLGKALNDPVKGISALSRAGVTFTDQQKEQIKTLVKSGDVLGAQKIILGEVESQVGGVAAKSTTAGEKLKTAFDNAKEGLGTAFLPVLDKAEGGLRTKLLPLITDKIVPALPLVAHGFETAGHLLTVFGRIGAGALKPFVSSLGGGQSTVKSFVDYLDTHQSDITHFFVSGGHAAILFGKGVAAVVSGALKAYAGLSDGVGAVMDFLLRRTQIVVQNLAGFFDAIPGMDKAAAAAHRAADGLQAMRDQAARDDGGSAKARALAASIDGKLVPALDRADRGLKKVGNAEVTKAKQRDEARALALAVDAIGTRANGSQLHLKKFSDISKLASGEQKALRGRINDARTALGQQLSAARDAGEGQKKLTQTWETGRKRLYDEFRQMGLSKDEARRLAKQYAGVKPKVSTKIEQPGMKGARADTKDLDNKINGLNNKSVNIKYSSNAAQFAKSFKLGLTLNSGEHDSATSRKTGGMLPGYTPGRDVHRFVSPTGGVLDLSGGEPVMRPEFGRVVGKSWVDAANAAARSGGVNGVRQFLAGGQQAYATGGVYRNITTNVTTPGLGLPDFGSLTTRIARALGDKLGAAIGAKLDKAGGGNTGKALSYARAHVGHPYQFGTLWDCSGFISALHSIAKNEQPHRRYVTTSFVGGSANGFTRGKHSGFMVGVNPKPGKSGHMAGTINGVNVESAGGVGVRVGKSARGYNSPMFSWRGGLASGGFVGDLPYDLVDPHGERYDPRLRRAVQATPTLRTQLFDSGGMLQPGLTLAINGTGRPERIRTEVQERQLAGATTSRVTEHHYHGPDAGDLIRRMTQQQQVNEVMEQYSGGGGF